MEVLDRCRGRVADTRTLLVVSIAAKLQIGDQTPLLRHANVLFCCILFYVGYFLHFPPYRPFE